MNKRVLITGAGSYIGQSFKTYMASSDWAIDELDVRDEAWKAYDFSSYDAVFHVAAIVHLQNKNNRLTELYYQVNRDLAVEVAKSAKAQGVGQFIFMSTASVYGEHLTQETTITATTQPEPTNGYGKSKLEAEHLLQKLADTTFSIVILRPPMIYGPATKGNYPRLAKLALKLPLFPKVVNRRSMIFIDNFSEFVRLMILHKENGIFHPQNTEYIQTSQLVKDIAAVHGHRLVLVPGFQGLLRFLASKMSVFHKLFGDFVYEQNLSTYHHDYNIVAYEESIRRSEQVSKK